MTFGPLKNRYVEGKIHSLTLSNDLSLTDFGFKYEIEMFTHELALRLPDVSSIRDKCNYIKQFSVFEFQILILKTFFLSNIVIRKKKKVIDFRLLFFLLLSQKKKRKNYFKGRYLNDLRGGYSIGICGYTAFLPRSHSLFKPFGFQTLFFLLSLNIDKHTMVVSQRRLYKIVRRRLVKLSSRLSYLKKTIIKKTISKVNITQVG